MVSQRAFRGFLLVLLTLIAAPRVPHARGPDPADSLVRARMWLSHYPRVGETAMVTVDLQSFSEESVQVEVRLRAPATGNLIDGKDFWIVDVPAGEKISVTAPIQFSEPGVWALSSLVTSRFSAGSNESEVYVVADVQVEFGRPASLTRAANRSSVGSWIEFSKRKLPDRPPQLIGALPTLISPELYGFENRPAVARGTATTLDEDGFVRCRFLMRREVEFSEQLATKMNEMGARNIAGGVFTFTADVPLDEIGRIADGLPEVATIEPLRTTNHDLPQFEGPTALKGLYDTEGVELTGAWTYDREQGGSGTAVAIIENSWDSIDYAIQRGDLPASVIRVDCTANPPGCEEVSQFPDDDPNNLEEHGTSCADIVHDMAPGADLYLIKAKSSEQLAAATDYILSYGEIRLISYSVGTYTGNFMDGSCWPQENVSCQPNKARSAGVFWASAAGNHARRHYMSRFLDEDGDSFHDTDITVSVSGPGDRVSLILNWDAWDRTNEDYALYLFDPTGEEVIAYADVDQTGDEEPTESLDAPPLPAGTYHIRIKKVDASVNHRFKVFARKHQIISPLTELGLAARSSLLAPADAAGAFAVGAIPKETWPTGSQDLDSSQGPTTDARLKPEIVAPTNVTTIVTTDINNGFTGTSAATPHVAGAAALVLSANPEFSVSDLWAHLALSAIDMGETPGQDNIYGYGRLNLCLEPQSPSISAPNHVDTGQSYHISWTETTRDRVYELQESTSPSFSNPTVWAVPNSESWYFSHTVSSPTTYYYRVRARQECNGYVQESDWSETASTTVGSSTGWIDLSQSANSVNVNESVRLDVDVFDRFGEMVPQDTAVVFSTTYPGSFFGNGSSSSGSPSTVLTDSSGHTWIEFSSTVVGTANISIASPGAAGAAVQVEFQNPNPSLNIAIAVSYLSGSGSTSTYELEAVVRDPAGSPISGQRVDFTASRGSLSATHDFTGPTGVADVDLTVSSSGEVTVTASAGGNQTATTFYAQVGAGDPPEMSPTRTFSMDGSVNGVDFSPNGGTLVAGSFGGELRAWNTSDWSSKWSTTTTDDRIGQVSVSPDGTYVMAAMDDGAEIHYTSNGDYYCLAGNADSKGVTGVWTSNVAYLETSFEYIYRHSTACAVGSPTSAQPLPGHGFERAGHMDYSSTKGWAAVATDEGDVIVLTASGNLVTNLSLTASGDNAFDTAFSANGGTLAAVAYNVVKAYSTATWSATSYSPPNLSQFKYGVAFVDNDTKLAIGGEGRVELVDLASHASVRYGTVLGNAVELSWNQSTEELAVGTSSGNLYIFKPLDLPPPPDNQGPTIAISFPSNNSSTNEPSLTTTGRVTDATGVAGFTINGTPVSLTGSGDFSHKVTLSEGFNTISYWAQDSAPGSNESNATRSVTLLVDRVPPVISGPFVNPTEGPVGTSFTIQSDVIDGDTGVESVSSTIWDSEGLPVATIPMSAGATNRYSGEFDSTASGLGSYSIDITAVDSSPQSNTSTINSAAAFSIVQVNNPPLLPSTPSPENGATGVPLDATLSWTGGDPDDEDTVTYDVYLENGDETPDVLVCENVSETSCAPPGGLKATVTYYWQIVARDAKGQTAVGPTWQFLTVVRIPLVERNALIALYENANGDSWNNRTNWRNEGNTEFGEPGTECTWAGISCNGALSHVQGIYMWNNNLSGSLPEELSDLRMLNRLVLSYNWSLESGPFPFGLSSLTNLTDLQMNSTNRTGPIPDLSGATGLWHLELGYNQGLNPGPIPAWIQGLSNMRYLNLNGTNRTGPIPPWLGQLPVLERLDLGNNELSGQIPSELSGLATLDWLDLGRNDFEAGPIPEWVKDFTTLRILNLGETNRTGPIPGWIGDLTGLQSLWLNRNPFNPGPLPTEIQNLTGLRQFIVGKSHRTGSIPAWLGSLTSLRELHVDGNQFVGEIPPDLINLTNLTDNGGLDIRWNGLSSSSEELSQFLNQKQYGGTWPGGNWQETQTVPPADISVECLSDSSARVSWTPITFTDFDGGYRVLRSTTSGGPYIDAGATAEKTDNGLVVEGLNFGETYYFVVQTVTGPHEENPYTVESESSEEIEHTLNCFTVSVTKAGTGSGDVTSNPPGIDCGEDCAETYQIETEVTLTASPDLGSTFEGWIGAACGGLGTCTFTVDSNLMVSATFSASMIPPAERQALIELYNSTNGGSWTNRTNWRNVGDTGFNAPGTECTWFGITCDAGKSRVTSIDLTYNNLVGQIPAEIDNFSDLQDLVLVLNSLDGPFPQAILGLSSLQRLNLRQCGLSGDFPPDIGNLTSLRYLNLAENDLIGPLPPSLGNLSNLTHLIMESSFWGHNRIYSIPPEIGQLENLLGLWLRGTSLVTIPDELADCKKLGLLDFSNNQLTGPIPEWLGGLSELVHLDLSNNELSGNIPDNLGDLSELYSLILKNNGLSGGIPPTLGALSKLRGLYLQGNVLSGELPNALIGLTGLIDFGLNIRWNALFSEDPATTSFFDAHQPGWESTQTVAPAAVNVASIGDTTVWLNWDPVTYQAEPGGYEVLFAPIGSMEWRSAGWTNSKAQTDYPVTGLDPGSEYAFAVASYTQPHANNHNRVTSNPSSQIVATTSSMGCLPPSVRLDWGDPVTLSVQGTYDSYSWSTGGSDPAIPISLPPQGWYWVTVTSAGPCEESGSIFVDPAALFIDGFERGDLTVWSNLYP